MAVGWFLVPYVTEVGGIGRATRVLDIDRFTPQITAAGGSWAEIEVLGNHALVKVRRLTEDQIAPLGQIYTRLPNLPLNTLLSELTLAQRTAIRNRVEALGYTAQEITAALGADLGQITLRQLLRFIASRRRKPRFDQPSQTVVFDGPDVVPESPDLLEERFPD